MSQESTHLTSTTSLCPVCLERVSGGYEARDDAVYLSRSCPEHGSSSRKVWESLDHWEWASDFGPTNEADVSDDLTVDGDHACLAVIEITQDCNLSCSYCFASSGPGGTQRSFEDVTDLLETVQNEGGIRPIQFSGGEPTVHDELPELVERAREMGFEHVEVNTNGINLTREGYAKRLADAGVTAIYLQFDGITQGTHETIREADLLDSKHRALAACRRVDLPVILVPTVVPGVNDDEMGDVVRFALENIDVVQSVNFQPVAHFGRYAENDGRFSLDEAARKLATQIEALEPRDFLPVPCCSSYCQMGTAFMPNGDGDVIPLTGLLNLDNWETLSGLIDETDWMELLAGTPVGDETMDIASSCCGIDVPCEVDVLPVTLTGFMDADAADVNRLDNCCISVPTPDGDLVPFCAYNMTTEDGRYELRNRHSWGGRDSVSGQNDSETAIVENDETGNGGM